MTIKIIKDPPRDLKTGRFLVGIHYSLNTEFKKGQHWRNHKPYWDKEWLYNEYIIKEKSADQIAQENGCNQNNIFYFIKKFGIRTRTMSEIRKNKYWGSPGEQNGMYGRRGEDSPHWLGGITPERQSLYITHEWRDIVKQIWNRDNATCVRCGLHRSAGMEMHIHHIASFMIVTMRCDPNNLILLCKKCHNYIHSKKNKNGEFLAYSIHNSKEYK